MTHRGCADVVQHAKPRRTAATLGRAFDLPSIEERTPAVRLQALRRRHVGTLSRLQVRPFFVTPYPGTEWYYTYKPQILAQYGGDLEAFILDLGDATRVTAVISKKFNAVELYGLRELMVLRDVKNIQRFEAEWNRLHANDPAPAPPPGRSLAFAKTRA